MELMKQAPNYKLQQTSDYPNEFPLNLRNQELCCVKNLTFRPTKVIPPTELFVDSRWISHNERT